MVLTEVMGMIAGVFVGGWRCRYCLLEVLAMGTKSKGLEKVNLGVIPRIHSGLRKEETRTTFTEDKTHTPRREVCAKHIMKEIWA